MFVYFVFLSKEVNWGFFLLIGNRWWWYCILDVLRDEIVLKNIFMIGLIGCGKIEIVRWFVKIVYVLFVKVFLLVDFDFVNI